MPNPRNTVTRFKPAEELFAKIERDAMRHNLVGYNPEYGPVLAGRPPYTPPQPVAAWLKTRPVEHKGRDYEALTKAALRKPVGFWEDAPRGKPFGGSGGGAGETSGIMRPNAPSAPASPCPVDDVWPKFRWNESNHKVLIVFSADRKAQFFDPYKSPRDWPEAFSWAECEKYWPGLAAPPSETLAWLSANGHKEYADTLRATKACPVDEFSVTIMLIENTDCFYVHLEDGAHHVWDFKYALDGGCQGGGGYTVNFDAMRTKANEFMVATLRAKALQDFTLAPKNLTTTPDRAAPTDCARAWKWTLGPQSYEGWRWILQNGEVFANGGFGNNWHKVACHCLAKAGYPGYVELHGEEAARVIAECRKAMRL